MYRAICHTTCYWRHTLWNVGDVYEGEEPPNKHFSKDGKTDKPLPPTGPSEDPRSTKQMIAILKEKFNVKVPRTSARKTVWAKLRDYEIAESKDELTNPKKGPGRPSKE